MYLEEEYFENVNFEKAKGKNYGYYNGIASSYTFVALGIPHQGTIYVIQKGTQLMTIMEQEAIEDTKDNKKGFETLRETFKF